MSFDRLFPRRPAIVGMIHLAPLPDYPQSPGLDALVEQALQDLDILERVGFDAALVENEYDRPHRVLARPETISAMTTITTALVEHAKIAVGCEILLNDPRASLQVAKDAGAQFIRTDYFVDRMSRPEYGEFDIDPDGLVDHRRNIGADEVLIFADIQVKYATMLESRSIRESAQLATRHAADAIVVTGSASGDSPLIDDLTESRQGADVPVLIGSGLDFDNASELLPVCDGAIVGSSLMREGRVDETLAGRLAAAAGR